MCSDNTEDSIAFTHELIPQESTPEKWEKEGLDSRLPLNHPLGSCSISSVSMNQLI